MTFVFFFATVSIKYSYISREIGARFFRYEMQGITVRHAGRSASIKENPIYIPKTSICRVTESIKPPLYPGNRIPSLATYFSKPSSPR